MTDLPNDFLAALSSRKRKALRKERERAQGFGGTIRALRGEAIEDAACGDLHPSLLG